jgi:tetratricopeptide (TPR) repeat protein
VPSALASFGSTASINSDRDAPTVFATLPGAPFDAPAPDDFATIFFAIESPSFARFVNARYNSRSTKMTQAQKSRREMLEKFVATRPADAFARYGLAMECMNTGDDEAAGANFQYLIENHPEYVAAYYQYGQFLARLGREAEARKLLSDGIVVAQRAGDIHARDEMQGALNSLR